MDTFHPNKSGNIAKIAVFTAAAGIPAACGLGYLQNHPQAVATISHTLSESLLHIDGGLTFVPTIFQENRFDKAKPCDSAANLKISTLSAFEHSR
ncbi:MAG TPA: hypothetical protein VGZ00_12290 [Candidatus Baltobacteraceae bacterium]|jgi:hypothetical protein|nr:hypothetical protein [Candidatus Baltobacteraceae bacterium]